MSEKISAVNLNKLIEHALDVRRRAYAPYSGFAVGACLLCGSGRMYTGCNVESAAFSPTICAERTALARAVAEGEREFLMLAIVGGPVAEQDVMSTYIAPCGVCRQSLYEFSKDGSLAVVMARSPGDYRVARLDELLPMAFAGW